jgi:hypothetical protein
MGMNLGPLNYGNMRMFENRKLGRIFLPKGEEVAGSGELYNEEIHNSCSTPNIRMNESRKI